MLSSQESRDFSHERFKQHAYKILQEDGKLEMEMQKTFWSENYAKLTDKYGIHWQLSTE